MDCQVSAVVVNYNGADCIGACLRSLLEQVRPPDEIVVIDNGSSDGSDQFVRNQFPDVILLTPGRNLGYASACNLGLRRTRHELVAFLNNDLTVDRFWLRNLLEEVRQPWDFWASRIVFSSHPDRIDSAGDGMAVIGSAFKHGHGESSEGYLARREVFGPCGAAALYRRSLLETVGGFDDDFFLVYEDADLNLRARLMGFKCLYVPDAMVFHRVNARIGTMSDGYVYYGQRNSEFVFWKDMPLALLIAYLPERILFDLLAFSYFLVKGRAAAFLRAKYDFIRNLRRTLGKRRVIQRSRLIGAGELRPILERNWLKYRWKKRGL